ncbi:hypothetical protein CXG81DRAFT_27590 [Caulochytrium protostelioides]|uniref:Thioredoxin domain-containing protein n=1 Tax=Caulochytrium protostelioides TaxID=1555241 RepID=A0A4P9X3N9_9FUNG|nr:hypothetical protein CXG81DRAFT_27590 [Caulochytrium protostelioides]|eukprot:RKO99659.1 hypothetical protein CXG81DRAFT_27590 [Caulochytrium protostelioides]
MLASPVAAVIAVTPGILRTALAAAWETRPAAPYAYVYLVASRDPATGVSWCPDCQASDPVVHAAFAAQPSLPLIEVPVGDRATWRTTANAWRADPAVHAASVPTLIRWPREAGPEAVAYADRLVEDQITPEAIAAWIAS